MRKIIVLYFVFISTVLTAQLKIPQVSPATKINQTVGLTNVEITYSRPSAKGRTVFGELVPYGKNWRTGANENTVISFSENVIIEGKELVKGKYALYTLPKADKWDVIFYKDYSNWGLPEFWSEDNVVLRVTIASESLLRHVETFTLAFSNLNTDSATLELVWEKTFVPIKINFSTQTSVIKAIEDVLDGPSAEDYFTSSQYYYQVNNDLNKALIWINRAIELKKTIEIPFWYYRLKGLILYKLGDKNAAIENVKISLEGAKKANNQDYIKQNMDSLSQWAK